VHTAKPVIEEGGDGSGPLINWDTIPYLCNHLELTCVEGPAARGIRRAGDLKGERYGPSSVGTAPHGERDGEDGHKTGVGKCPFLSKTCGGMPARRAGRSMRGGYRFTGIDKPEGTYILATGEIEPAAPSGRESARGPDQYPETPIPAVGKCLCGDTTSLTLPLQFINQRLKVHLHYTPVYVYVCIHIFTFPYTYIYIHTHTQIQAHTKFKTSQGFGLPAPHTPPLSFCLQSPLKVPATVQQFPPWRKKRSKNKGLSVPPIQKFKKKKRRKKLRKKKKK